MSLLIRLRTGPHQSYVFSFLSLVVIIENLLNRSGLKRGDVIIGANEHPIAKNADLFDILRNTPELRLIVIRENVELRITVKADEKEG